ncbi:EAL domain-containing protein [Lampropedia puyangensis]|uniref:EAL domain-containing protein n=1 Tax=Lampropedia puyangensis TaxID=1330072 RepID=A0A4S8F082_9BURK|nr:EAL domain-containing protein [Lampropedia puyangensis]THU00279.1 EAL domain-containing protein [Lampropedia puyangensis]
MNKRSYSLQTHLLALLAVALLPVLLVGAVATALGSRQLHESALQQLQDNASALTELVDQRFVSYAQILRLMSRDRSAAMVGNAAVSHADLTLVDLRKPEQRMILPSAFLEKLDAGQDIAVSDLITSRAPGPLHVAIGLASDASDGAASFAMMVPSTDIIDFAKISMLEAPKASLIAVVDSQGRIVARSRDQAQWLGQEAPDWGTLQVIDADYGIFSASSAEGRSVKMAFKRLKVATGWALIVGEDEDVLNASWRVPLRGMLLGALVTAIVSLLLARWASRRILLSLKTVQGSSRAVVADSEAPRAQDQQSGATIREFDELSDNWLQAQGLLKDQAYQAKALATRLQRNEARHRAVAEVGALVFWQASPNWEIKQLTGWRELTGQSEAQALGGGWQSRVHPRDLTTMEANWPEGDDVDLEFRVLDVHERWHWVRARGARIGDSYSGEAEWAGVLEDVDARMRAQARIGYLAKYDPLTGLANRSYFHDVLAAALSREEPRWAAVLCMGLDRFIQINDTLGHSVGDELLQRVTARLMGLLPQDGLLARFGGDEFALLFKTAMPLIDSQQLGEQILTAFQEPFLIHDNSINVNLSIGIALSQSVTDSAEQLMRHADMALHRAKADGRGRLRFFERAMDQQIQHRREMEVDLRKGIEKAQFHLVYQPVVNLSSLQLVGFEALLRWQHPYMGMLDPGRFLPIAEDIGLMEPLGAWVLKQACLDACCWPDASLSVAVNVAASQLHGALLPMVAGVLAQTHLTPHRLELEVTENALMAHIESAAKGLLELKSQGVAIVLDDFGTGYTSLSHLRAFPFDKVKIDKAFVQDLSSAAHEYDGAAIIAAIGLLCKRLGIVAVAEGVETIQQMNQVLGYECQQAQGFLFGRPLRQEEVCQLIVDWPAIRQRIALLQTPQNLH